MIGLWIFIGIVAATVASTIFLEWVTGLALFVLIFAVADGNLSVAATAAVILAVCWARWGRLV